MKKITSFFIGAIILFSGMHIMPANTMASGMNKTHCSACTEEDRLAGNCKPEKSNTRKENFQDLFPLGQNCDCDFSEKNKGRHEAAFANQQNQLKNKLLQAGLTKSNISEIPHQLNFLTAKQINAPPHAYMGGFRTVQQLK